MPHLHGCAALTAPPKTTASGPGSGSGSTAESGEGISLEHRPRAEGRRLSPPPRVPWLGRWAGSGLSRVRGGDPVLPTLPAVRRRGQQQQEPGCFIF